MIQVVEPKTNLNYAIQSKTLVPQTFVVDYANSQRNDSAYLQKIDQIINRYQKKKKSRTLAFQYDISQGINLADLKRNVLYSSQYFKHRSLDYQDYYPQRTDQTYLSCTASQLLKGNSLSVNTPCQSCIASNYAGSCTSLASGYSLLQLEKNNQLQYLYIQNEIKVKHLQQQYQIRQAQFQQKAEQKIKSLQSDLINQKKRLLENKQQQKKEYQQKCHLKISEIMKHNEQKIQKINEKHEEQKIQSQIVVASLRQQIQLLETFQIKFIRIKSEQLTMLRETLQQNQPKIQILEQEKRKYEQIPSQCIIQLSQFGYYRSKRDRRILKNLSLSKSEKQPQNQQLFDCFESSIQSIKRPQLFQSQEDKSRQDEQLSQSQQLSSYKGNIYSSDNSNQSSQII